MDVAEIKIEDAKYNYYICQDYLQVADIISEEEKQSDHTFFIYDANIPYNSILSLVSRCVSLPTILSYSIAESDKNMDTLIRIISDMINNGATRNSIFFIVGGGVLGNIAGLACGMLFRGVKFYHIPSTIMACSDSVLSLKQGINMHNTKNIVGMYYPPNSVMVCPELFHSLSIRDIKAGYVELIKNMLIVIPEEIPAFLDSNLDLSNLSFRDIDTLIKLSIRAKLQLIEHDKHEKSKGLLLEYGHTVGHALEMLFPNDIRHGEGVAVGILSAVRLCEKLNYWDGQKTVIVYDLLNKIGIFELLRNVKTMHPSIDIKEYRILLKNDNKRGYINCAENEIAMVLLTDYAKPLTTGDQYVFPVNVDLVVEVVREIWEQVL